MKTDKPERIALSRADAADRIQELERSADYCQQELESVMDHYQMPRFSTPQIYQAKRHLRLAVEHLACAAELAAKGGAD